MTTTITKHELNQFIGTTQYYRHPLCRTVIYTDGIKYLCDNGAAWLIDTIASRLTPKLYKYRTVFFTLTKDDDNSATLVGFADIDEPPIIEQHIPFTDYPLPSQNIWAAYGHQGGWVMYLPSEH